MARPYGGNIREMPSQRTLNLSRADPGSLPVARARCYHEPGAAPQIAQISQHGTILRNLRHLWIAALNAPWTVLARTSEFGPCATETRKPRQVRKEATVAGASVCHSVSRTLATARNAPVARFGSALRSRPQRGSPRSLREESWNLGGESRIGIRDSEMVRQLRGFTSPESRVTSPDPCTR